MIQNHVTFLGGLTRVGELGYASNGNPYINFGLARNYSKRNDNGEYENVGSFYSSITLWGKEALCFAQSHIPLGTTLLVEGHFEHTVHKSYVNKDGIQVPEREEEVIVADNVAVLIGYKKKITVENADYSSLPEDGGNTTSRENKQEKPAKKSEKKQTTNVTKSDNIFANTEEENFSEDMFDDELDDTSDNDLFDDVDADDLFI